MRKDRFAGGLINQEGVKMRKKEILLRVFRTLK